jgi:hypothetical protein
MTSTYLPPAHLKDFDQSPHREALYAQWNRYMAALVSGDDAQGNPTLARCPAFFDPLKPPANVDGTPASPTWNGLPGTATRLYGTAAGNLVAPVAARIDAPVPFGGQDPILQGTKPFSPSENVYYRPQDEYLEWALVRDAQGKLREILFTSEAPDYWQTLWNGDKNLVVSLYQSLCGNGAITASDLAFGQETQDPNSGLSYKAGDYNPYNAYNRDFAIHLTQLANTLSAEVILAKESSLLWGSPPLTTDPARICCAQYGEANRNSDPTIGAGVNGAVLAGKRVSLVNPIALYIQGWDATSISVGDTPLPEADQLFQVVRGTALDQRILRLRFAVPAAMTFAGAPLTLDMLSVGGEPLTTGGQIANLIKVHLFAATAPGAPKQTPETCTGKVCFSAANSNLVVTIAPGATCPPGGVAAVAPGPLAARSALAVPGGRRHGRRK